MPPRRTRTLVLLLSLTLASQAHALTLGWDASLTPQPSVPAPDEVRYLVEQRLPGASAWLSLMPGVPLTQRTLDVVVAPGVPGTQHCFQVRTARITMGATPVLVAQSAPGLVQGSTTVTALCVPAAEWPLNPPTQFRVEP